METLRILVANEPRAFREAIVGAIRRRHPRIEVDLVEPEGLDRGVAERSPQLVICSAATTMIQTTVPAWIELNPARLPLATVSIDGQRSTVTGIGLGDLLSVIDQIEQRRRAEA